MPDKPDALMIFAAGYGTRMGALTAARPKPLIEVAGRPLLDHALALAEGVRPSRIAVNAHYLGEQIARHLAARPGVAVLVETPDILDTGGGLRAAGRTLGSGPVYTLNSDAVWTGANPLSTLRAAWDPARMDALVLLVPRERATGHAGTGDFLMSETGALTRGDGMVYTGAQIVNTDRLAEIDARVFSLNPLWDRLIAEGRLHGVLHPDGWCDVGRPESIPLAERLLSGAGRG